MHAVGDHQGLVADPARLPDPLHLGVQPQIRIGAGQWPLTEHADLLVQAAAQPGDLVLAHAVQPQLLDQPVDLAGRHPVDIGLLDDRDQGLFSPPARLQEAREVAARCAAWGWPARAPRPGCPSGEVGNRCAGSAAVGGALTQLGADQRAHLGLHQLGDQPGHALAQHISVLICHAACRPTQQRSSCGPRPSWRLLRRSLDRPTIMRHTVADSYSATTAALLHHSPRLDPAVMTATGMVLVADTPSRPGSSCQPRMQRARPEGWVDRSGRRSAPGAGWPAGGSRLLGSGGGHQGSSGTAACLPWPSGTRSWATRAGCRPPRRDGGSWAGRGRPCRWVGLPPGIPFRAADPDAVPGPDWTEWSSGHEGGRGASDDAAVTLLRAVRTGRSCGPTPRAGHSPIGSFLRTCT